MDEQKQENLLKYILPRRESRYFGSLLISPANVHFPFQKKSEKVYLLTRKHFITNFVWIFRSVFFFFLPLIALIITSVVSPEFFELYIITDTVFEYVTIMDIIAMIFMYYSAVLFYAWSLYIHWFFNVYIITNERMIHTNFKIMSGITVVESPLDNVQDISQETHGLLPSLFNYGNVKVQTTVALKSRFNFISIPDPSWFKSILYELIKLVNGEEP